MTTRAAIYTRISLDQAGDAHGVGNQDDACDRHAGARGFVVEDRHRYCDNDISASNGKHRPGYAELMAAAARREFDVIVVFHTSRIWRSRRERADAIEILRQAAVSVVAVKGPSLDMSTAYGRGMAGLLGEFDTMETEVKAERQVLAAAQRAENGKPPLGTRLMGYTPKGEVIEPEAAAVRGMFERFHAGASLREIVAWLDDTGVLARHGGPWNPSTVRTILANPRYCGRAVYMGQANGHAGAWKPVVSEAVWDLVNVRLSDPRRRTQAGTDRRHLGSSLYECGTCGRPLRAHARAGATTYRCPGHLTRNAAPVDVFVLAVLRGRLARPDLAGLLTAADSEQSRQAAAEITRHRARLKQTEADYDNDLIDARRYKVKAEKIRAELDTATRAQARLSAGSGVAGTLTAPDPVAAFDSAPLGIQRAVLGFLMTVRLLPAPRGRHFSPDTVEIRWRQEEAGS